MKWRYFILTKAFMSKIFYTELPEDEASLEVALAQRFPQTNSSSLFAFVMMRKLSTDLDVSLDAYFAKYNLSVGRFTLLNLLSFFEEGLMPSELANKVGVTQATISGLINSLEKANLVSRQTHKKDGRAFVIKLTTNGSELVQKICPEYFGRIDKIMDAFSTEEKQSLRDLMLKLTQRLSIINEA